MDNVIKLTFPQDLNCIAGSAYGESVCNEQVLPKLNAETLNIVEIPSGVEQIAIGFVQGMKRAVLGFNAVTIVRFKSENKDLEKKVNNDYNY